MPHHLSSDFLPSPPSMHNIESDPVCPHRHVVLSSLSSCCLHLLFLHNLCHCISCLSSFSLSLLEEPHCSSTIACYFLFRSVVTWMNGITKSKLMGRHGSYLNQVKLFLSWTRVQARPDVRQMWFSIKIDMLLSDSDLTLRPSCRQQDLTRFRFRIRFKLLTAADSLRVPCHFQILFCALFSRLYSPIQSKPLLLLF